MVERNNGFLETSFLPGCIFSDPADFNVQLADWLATANSRTVRAIGARPVDLLAADRAATLSLPPIAPTTGIRTRVRLARDYYVRVDTCDYSVDPRVIGRFVDVVSSPSAVEVRCGGELVASHARSWARRAVITDPAHVETAKILRREHAQRRAADTALARRHSDGHAVMLRPLPDYDALFDVDVEALTPSITPNITPNISEATPS